MSFRISNTSILCWCINIISLRPQSTHYLHVTSDRLIGDNGLAGDSNIAPLGHIDINVRIVLFRDIALLRLSNHNVRIIILAGDIIIAPLRLIDLLSYYSLFSYITLLGVHSRLFYINLGHFLIWHRYYVNFWVNILFFVPADSWCFFSLIRSSNARLSTRFCSGTVRTWGLRSVGVPRTLPSHL